MCTADQPFDPATYQCMGPALPDAAPDFASRDEAIAWTQSILTGVDPEEIVEHFDAEAEGLGFDPTPPEGGKVSAEVMVYG
jgi:hypothetical protein